MRNVCNENHEEIKMPLPDVRKNAYLQDIYKTLSISIEYMYNMSYAAF